MGQLCFSGAFFGPEPEDISFLGARKLFHKTPGVFPRNVMSKMCCWDQYREFFSAPTRCLKVPLARRKLCMPNKMNPQREIGSLPVEYPKSLPAPIFFAERPLGCPFNPGLGRLYLPVVFQNPKSGAKLGNSVKKPKWSELFHPGLFQGKGKPLEEDQLLALPSKSGSKPCTFWHRGKWIQVVLNPPVLPKFRPL